jgi:hypothetical protein
MVKLIHVRSQDTSFLRRQWPENSLPLKWLDNLSMRNFTNASVFDDTVPISDGLLEIGNKVPLEQLKEAMEDWFRRKSYLPKESRLSLEEK